MMHLMRGGRWSMRPFAKRDPLHWIALAAVILAGVDTFLKSISLTALGLLAIGALPWLLHLLRSIELPGGIKLGMRDLQRAGEELTGRGEVPQEITTDQPGYLLVRDRDPNLALAGLRIEIEKRLRDLARIHGLDATLPLTRLIGNLQIREVITPQEQGSLKKLIGTLNSAVHGAQVPQNAYDWAMDVGPSILAVLGEKRVGD